MITIDVANVPERSDASLTASVRRAEIVLEVYSSLTGDANMIDLLRDLMLLRIHQEEDDEFDLLIDLVQRKENDE